MAANPMAPSTGSSAESSLSGVWTRTRAFLGWWRSELIAAMPPAWRERLAGGLSGTPFMLLPDELVAYSLTLGRLEASSRVPLACLDAPGRVGAVQRLIAAQGGRADAVLLVLPAESFIRKTIELPAAAEEALHQVLGFELDRHTPFKPAAAVYAARVLGRTRDNANIRVELVAAPRAAIERLLRDADGVGVRVNAIIPQPEDGTGWREFDLLPRDATVPAPFSADTRLNLILAAVFLLLFAAALVIPLVQKREAVIELLPRLNAAKVESEKVQKTRSEVEQLVGDANFVLGKKHSQVSVTHLVEDLAKVFPDTTWVAVLELKSGKQKELVLTGETGSATRFVELLEQVSYLKNPSFRSPLSKTPGQSAERFVIAAEVRPRPLPAVVDETSAAPAGPATATPSAAAPPASATASPAVTPAPASAAAPTVPPQSLPSGGGKAPPAAAPTPAAASPAPPAKVKP